MSRVTFRPATAEDLEAVTGRPQPLRFKGLTATIDGEVVGVMGFLFRRDGAVLASAHITDRLRAHPVALHRAGLRLIAWARAAGVPLVLAAADPTVERAPAWLKRLGFAAHPGRARTFAWRPVASDNPPSHR